MLTQVKRCQREGRQRDIVITLNSIRKQMKRIPNWKAAGPDGVQGYWLKNFGTLHQRLCNQWMAKGLV